MEAIKQRYKEEYGYTPSIHELGDMYKSGSIEINEDHEEYELVEALEEAGIF